MIISFKYMDEYMEEETIEVVSPPTLDVGYYSNTVFDFFNENFSTIIVCVAIAFYRISINPLGRK